MIDRKTKYKRWLEFSLNLADAHNITSKRKEKLKEEIESFIVMYALGKAYDDRPLCGWDVIVDTTCIGEHVSEFFEEYEVLDQHGEQAGAFYNQITSCIRAGLDVAVPDMCGGGVVGFTIGDVRVAYGGNMPGWLINVLKLNGGELDDTYIWL